MSDPVSPCQIKSVHTRSSQSISDQVSPIQIKSVQVSSCRIKSVQVRSSQSKSDQTSPSQTMSDHVRSSQSKSVQVIPFRSNHSSQSKSVQVIPIQIKSNQSTHPCISVKTSPRWLSSVSPNTPSSSPGSTTGSSQIYRMLKTSFQKLLYESVRMFVCP